MDKLREAAREVVRQHSMECLSDKAIEALREALEHPVKLAISEEAFNWIDANAPMFVREALAEQAEQEPIGNISLWHNHGHQNHNVEYYGTLPDGLHQLYAAPVRTKDMTDIEYLQDAVTKALKKAFHLGQTYWQQADSESYAANKKADVTQELFFKLKDDTRAVIAADREKNR